MLSAAFMKFPSFFLYKITSYVDESVVIISVWIVSYRLTTHNVFGIRQIFEKIA